MKTLLTTLSAAATVSLAALGISAVGAEDPAATRPTAALAAPPNQVMHKTVQIDGLDIFYREAGSRDAPTVLLLHGFPTSSHMFRNLIPELATDYHVVAPDYPGYGNSSTPSVEEFDYTFDNLTDIVDQLTAKLELSSYTLYLMDYGARSASGSPRAIRRSRCARHPERQRPTRKDCASSGSRSGPIGGIAARPTRKPLRKFLALDGTKWQYTHGVRNVEAISPDNWNIDQRLLDREGNQTSSWRCSTTTAATRRSTRSGRPGMRANQPPTLIVWGKNDHIFPRRGRLPLQARPAAPRFPPARHRPLRARRDGTVIAERMLTFLHKHVTDPDDAMNPPVSDIAFHEVRQGRARTARSRKATRAWSSAGAGVTPSLRTSLPSSPNATRSTSQPRPPTGSPTSSTAAARLASSRCSTDKRLAFADYSGNKQYISMGNLEENDRAFLFLMDYPNRQRIKVWGRAEFVEDDEALLEQVRDPDYRAEARARARLPRRSLGRQLPTAHHPTLHAGRHRVARTGAEAPHHRARSRERAAARRLRLEPLSPVCPYGTRYPSTERGDGLLSGTRYGTAALSRPDRDNPLAGADQGRG